MKENSMTNEERIVNLEARLATAERRIAELEARTVVPLAQPYQPSIPIFTPTFPYQPVTCGAGGPFESTYDPRRVPTSAYSGAS
jgi:hypothetical protein